MRNSDIKVFVIEDDELYSKMVERKLREKTDYQLTIFSSVESILSELKLGNKPHLIVTDYYLGSKVRTALQLIDDVSQIDATIPIVVMTAQSDLKLAVDLLRKGAFDFIVKDSAAFEKIISTVCKVAELMKLKEEINMHKKRSKRDLQRLTYLLAAAVSCLLLFSFF